MLQVHRVSFDRESNLVKTSFFGRLGNYTEGGEIPMFDKFNKRMNLTVHDVGQLIQRFPSDSLRYPQEWNDFVDTKQRKPESERYRRRCYQLDPSVNRPGKVDEAALMELRTLAASTRKETYLPRRSRTLWKVPAANGIGMITYRRRPSRMTHTFKRYSRGW